MYLPPLHNLEPFLFMLWNIQAIHEIYEPGAEQIFQDIGDRYGDIPFVHPITLEEFCLDIICYHILVECLPDQFDLLEAVVA